MASFYLPDDIAKVFPIVRSLRTYHMTRFYADFIGGLTVMFTLIPQSLAYAQLAGVPAIWGLYAATFPLYIYAIFGSSNHIVYGPFAVTCYMLGDIANKYSMHLRDPQHYIQFVMYVSWLAGVIYLIMWLLRLGSIVSLVTPNVLSSFVTGCALSVWSHQIPNALGYSVPRDQSMLVVLSNTFANMHKTTSVAACISILTYIFLQSVVYYKRVRKSRVVAKDVEKSARYKAVSFALNCAFFFAFLVGYSIAKYLSAFPDSNAARQLVTVGYVPPGFQKSVFKFPDFMPTSEALNAISDALTLVIVSVMINWSICKKFADQFGYEVNIQNELFASGMANIIGPLVNAFYSTGGLGRTAIGVESGARSQMSNVIAVTFIIIILSSFSGELTYIPLPTLGVITQVGVASLIDFQEQLKVYRKDKKEAAVMLVTTLVTFLMGVTLGVVFGVLISLLSELYGTAYPRIVPLGIAEDRGRDGEGAASMHRPSNMSDVSDSTTHRGTSEAVSAATQGRLSFVLNGRRIPRINIVRVECPSLYFGNAFYVCQHLLHIAQRSESDYSSSYLHDSRESTAAYSHRKHLDVPESMETVLIVDVSPINRIDEAAVIELQSLARELAVTNTTVAYVQGPQFYEEAVNAEGKVVTIADIESGSSSHPQSQSPVADQSSSGAAQSGGASGLATMRRPTAYPKVSPSAAAAAGGRSKSRDSVIEKYTNAPIAVDMTHYSTVPHVTGQLALAGARKHATASRPITHFASLDEAVKYYTFHFYLQTLGRAGVQQQRDTAATAGDILAASSAIGAVAAKTPSPTLAIKMGAKQTDDSHSHEFGTENPLHRR